MTLKLRQFLFEDPDTVNAKLQNIKINAYTEPNYPFGYYNGKMYIGEENEYHGDMYIDDSIKNITREQLDYPGRIWTLDKIISFWEFPKSKDTIKIINDLNAELKNKKLRYRITDKWFIDSVNSNFNEYLVSISDFINKKLSPRDLFGIKNWQEMFQMKNSNKYSYANIYDNKIIENVDSQGNHKPYDSDAYTFGFFKNKGYIVNGSTHYYLKKNTIKFSMEDELDWKDKLLKAKDSEYRYVFDYPGRLWKNDKIISFWKCPAPKKMQYYINALNNALLNMKTETRNPEMSKLYDWKISINNWNLNVSYDSGRIYGETIIKLKDYINQNFEYDAIYPGFDSEFKLIKK
jgi:hypothetical protein